MEKVTADPQYRKRVLVKAVIYLATVFVLLQWIIPKVSLQLMKSNPGHAFLFLECLIFLILIFMIVSWIHILRVGIQCIKQRRYPPKDVPVIRDIVISTDKPAVVRGGFVIASALIAIALSIYLCITLASIVLAMFP